MHSRPLSIAYGALCHGLFGVAVTAMMGNLYLGMQHGLGPSGPWAVLWDVALLAQFPLLHSWLLSKRGGRWMRRFAPADAGGKLDTTLFATAASLQVLAVFALWAPLGGPTVVLEGPLAWGISAVFAGGWLLLLRAMYEAGMGVQTGSAGWTALWRGDRPRYPKGFASAGLHGVIRHPIYASFALLLWAGPVWSVDKILLAIPLTAYCVLGPRKKEARYRARYGAAWDAYAAATPAMLPRLRRPALAPAIALPAPRPRPIARASALRPALLRLAARRDRAPQDAPRQSERRPAPAVVTDPTRPSLAPSAPLPHPAAVRAALGAGPRIARRIEMARWGEALV